MTREQFFDLAQSVHAYARQHPRRYRLKVTLLAAFGYAVLFGMMAICAALLVLGGLSFSQKWFWEIAAYEGRLVVIWAGFLIGIALMLFAMVRSLFVQVPLPSGRRVQRADAPELFAMIDEVVAASQAPRPHTVLLSWDFNAAVCQRPRFGWFGRTRDFLVLGVPLMAALTPLQFKAVLAHEFGHLRGGHGRFGNRVYRLRTIWDQMLERLVRQRQKSVGFIAKFLHWYAPRFNAYTYALTRAQEFEADRWAAQVAGLPAAGEALVNIWTRGAQIQEQFWRPLNHRACHEAEVPRGVFAPMLALLRQPITRADQRRWLRATLAEVTDGTDTHPAPAERLATLGLPATLNELDADEMWLDDPAEPAAGETDPLREPTAARALLGTRLDEHLDELETGWRVVTAPVWRQRFGRAQAIRSRLEVLEREAAAAPAGELPEATAWERVRLEVDLTAEPALARELVERFVVRWSGHALSRFTLGRFLLNEDDEAGVAHVEEAMRLEPRLAADGEEALAAYLRRAGQLEAAATRRRLAVRHTDVLDAARAERANVTARDRFLPHGLDEPHLAAIRAHMAKHSRVTKVYLARKDVAHHPEQPCYVMVCIFKWRWNEYNSQKRINQILTEIRPGLTVADDGTVYFFLLEHRRRHQPIARKVRKAAGSEIFPLPVPKRRRRWWGGRQPGPANSEVSAPRTIPAPAELVDPARPALAFPPPLPYLPTAVPMPVRRDSRKSAAFAACAAALTVMLPLGFAAYTLLHTAGFRQNFRTAFAHRGFNAASSQEKLADAARPILRDPQATTEEDDRRHVLAWGQRTMLGGYTRVGRRNARWNAAAEAFIGRALPCWAGLHDYTLTPADLVPQARNVLRLGCDDPVVLFLAALVEERTDRQAPAAGPLFARAAAGFKTTAYPGGVALMAAEEFVADCDRRRDGTGQSQPARDWWLACFQQSLGDNSFPPEDQTVFVYHLCRGPGGALCKEFRHACGSAVENARVGAVLPWVRFYLTGKGHAQDAAEVRGTGYASTVSFSGWRTINSDLDLASRDLLTAWQLNPRRPEAASMMIGVSMGLDRTGAEGPRAWFDRVVRAQIDFEPAYKNFYIVLLPQWGGSVEAVLRFGLTCAATAAYDTGVPFQLNEAMRDIEPSLVYGNPEVSSALERVYAGYEAAPSQAAWRVEYHNWHAYGAATAGRYEQAFHLLKEVNFAMSPYLAAELAESQETSNYMERIAAYGGPGGADAQAGDRLVARGRPQSALEHFRAALAAAGTEPRASVYLQSRIGMLETERQLAAGNWISCQPAAGAGGAPVGWTSKLGTWHVAPDGALVGQAGASGMMLVNDAKPGTDFEIRGEADFLPGALGEVQAGVVFGHPDLETEDWQSFRIKRRVPGYGTATISCHWYDGPLSAVPVPDHNAFVLQSWHGQITVTINGKVMFREQRLDKGQVSDGSTLVGVGGYAAEGNSFAVAYRKLQLRRLNSQPLALDAGAAARAGTAAQVTRR